MNKTISDRLQRKGFSTRFVCWSSVESPFAIHHEARKRTNLSSFAFNHEDRMLELIALRLLLSSYNMPYFKVNQRG